MTRPGETGSSRGGCEEIQGGYMRTGREREAILNTHLKDERLQRCVWESKSEGVGR